MTAFRGFAAVAAVALLTMLAWWLERPPAPLSADAPADVFSAERARALLERIAVRPHMPGSAEHARVREILIDELESLGFGVEVQEATVVDPRGGVIQAATVRNILARKRGRLSTGGVALTAHYDSQQLSSGAGDDGAGVAAVLEAARTLSNEGSLRNDLYIVFTDAEELGLLGAMAFVADHSWWPEISVLLNFEARGSAGPSVLFETSAGNGWVVREFARADPSPSGSSLYSEIYKRLPNDTDFSVYKRAGIAGLNFAFAEGADVYHRSTDSVENLSLASLQHHGEHALSMGRHFGNLDLAAATMAPDVVFFRFGGLGLVTYSTGWAALFSGLALLFAGVVAYRGLADRRVSVAGIIAGLVMATATAILAAGLSALLLIAIRRAHHELGSIVGRELYNEAWYAFSVAFISIGAAATTLAIGRRQCGVASLAAGAFVVPLALAVASGWYAPGVSMLFVWPTVSAIAATRQLTNRADRLLDGADLMAFVLLAAPVVLMAFPLVWAIYIGLNVSRAPLMAVVVAMMLALMIPLLELATRMNRWWLPSASFGLAIAFGLVGVVDARPGAGRPVPSDLVYALDRDSGVALWATMAAESGDWLSRFVGNDAAPGDLAPFLSGDSNSYRLSAAPLVDAPDARLHVATESAEGEIRSVRLEIFSALGAELMSISPMPGRSVVLRSVNGTVVEPVSGPGAATDWILRHYGSPPGGALILDVDIDDASYPLELVLVESLMRLPPVTGVDIERPADVVAHGRRPTDVSLFRQVLRFEGFRPAPD